MARRDDSDEQIIGVRPVRDLEYVVDDDQRVSLSAACVYVVPYAVRRDTAVELKRLGEARLVRRRHRGSTLPGPGGPTPPPAAAGGSRQRSRRTA